MLNVRKPLARRVSIRHDHGGLLVHIARRNDGSYSLWFLVASTVIAVQFCSMAIKVFRALHMGIPYLLLLIMLVAVAWLAVLLSVLWGAFGEEEILVANGVMRWTHKALSWKHDSEIPAHEISEIEAITPWHARNNHVEFTAGRRRYKIGRRLLRDEANEITDELRRAVGLHLRAGNSGND